MTSSKRLQIWHDAGIHIYCKLAPLRTVTQHRIQKREIDGTWRKCSRPGTIDSFHHHDFDGELPCGCDDD